MKHNPVAGLVLDPVRESLVSSAGGVLLRQTVRPVGLDRELSAALKPWRSGRSIFDPGKVLLDLATAVALGGDCAADIAVVRAQPAVFGSVASDATVSRLVAALAADGDVAISAVRAARAAARERVWAGRRPVAGRTGSQVILDLDATLVTAHSDKELAAPTFKRGFGLHPLFALVDHGEAGSEETLAGMLRTGSAGANTAADHIAVLDAALAQLPAHERSRVLVRTDTGGAASLRFTLVSVQCGATPGSTITAAVRSAAGNRNHETNIATSSSVAVSQRLPVEDRNVNQSFKSWAYAFTVFGDRSIEDK